MKKIIYATMLLLIIFFIYNVYLKPVEDTVQETSSDIETKNIKIFDEKQNYEIKASKQLDNLEKGDKVFELAEAFFEKSIIKGKNAILDKALNLVLKGDVTGEALGGWKFYTEEIKYNDKSGMFNSKTPIKIENELEKVTLTSDKMRSNRNFTVITVYDNVVLKTEDVTIRCKKATFNREKGIIRLSKDIEIEAKSLKLEGNDIENVRAELNYALYDVESMRLTAWGGLKAYYEGYELSAKNMVYYRDKGNVNIYEKVVIKKEDLIANMNKIFYNNVTRRIVVTGPISGKKGELDFEGDYGEMELDSENMRLMGHIKLYNEKNKVIADKVEYKKKDEIVTLNSNTNVYLYGEFMNMVANDVKYKVIEKTLYIEDRFYYNRKNLKGEGKNLVYSLENDFASMENNKIEMKDFDIAAYFVEADFKEKKYFMRKNVVIENGDYILKSEKAIADENEEMIYINDEYNLVNKKDKMEFRGKKGRYFNRKKIFMTRSPFVAENEEYIISGEELKYNLKNGSGKMKSGVKVDSKKRDLHLKGEELDYEKDKVMKLYGGVELYEGENLFRTRELDYNIPKNRVFINQSGILENKENNLIAKFKNGNYDLEGGIGRFDEIDGKVEDVKFRSDFGEYAGKESKFYFKNSCKIEKDNVIIESEEISYNFITSIAKTEVEMTTTVDNIVIKNSLGEVNLDTKIISAENVTLTTNLGDEMFGDYLNGYLDKKEFNFKGNLKADLSYGAKFTGELAKLFFVEDKESGESIINRAEIKDNAHFEYSDMLLNSDYIEVDTIKNLVFGKGTSVLKVDETTDVSSDYIYLDTEKEIGKMEGNVGITNRIDGYGTMTANADSALLKNSEKKVELIGNVKAVKDKNMVSADKGVLDLKTNTLAGEGNIHFKIDVDEKDKKSVEKQEDKEEKKKEIEKTKENIEEKKEIKKIEDIKNKEVVDENSVSGELE